MSTVGFPFQVTPGGSVAPADGDDAELRGKVIEVLFTAPGERVNLPDFGCGLFNLAFDPNNAVMAAAVEFTVGEALARWLGDALVVMGVDVRAQDEVLTAEVAYVKRADLTRQAVRVQFR
jgi:phage baseplate assembly protein W